MRSAIAKYLNEIVSLTVMALMFIALVDGQAGAEPRQLADDSRWPDATRSAQFQPQAAAEPSFVIDLPELGVDISFRLRHTGE